MNKNLESIINNYFVPSSEIEYKYRVFDTVDKKYLKEKAVRQLKLNYNYKKLILERYTGINDVYNKPIYEGDIVVADMCYGSAGWVNRKFVINFHNLYGYQWEYFNLETIKVIGNINENRNLLNN